MKNPIKTSINPQKGTQNNITGCDYAWPNPGITQDGWDC